MGSWAKAYDKMMHSGGWFTFLRSSISSQIASWTDMLTSFIFYAFVFTALDAFYRSNLSVCVGAVVGGVVNCCINYRFTFHAAGQSVRAVALKYFLVWTGSLLLNMYGTTGVATLLSRWQWLVNIGFRPDGIFAAARLFASLVVSLAWNFVLQRNFVYRPTRFDATAIAIVNLIIPQRRYDKGQNVDMDK